MFYDQIIIFTFLGVRIGVLNMKTSPPVIITGPAVWPDGKEIVKVIRAVGRSGAQFSVEFSDRSIHIVEKERL